MSPPALDLASRYRRTVASRYRALKAEELAEIPPGPTWLSPKLDGELWLAVLDRGEASLVAAGGRSLEGAPLLAELKAASARVKGRTILAGELFAAGAKGSRPRVGDVAAAISEGGKALERLGWHGFDALELDGAPAPTSYAERLAALDRILEGGKRTGPIKTVATSERADLDAHWHEWGASGKAEGMIVRAHDGRIFKVKPGFSVDVAVVGYTPRGDAPEEVRSLLVALVRPDGTFQLVGAVGNLGTEDARRRLLAALAPLECASRFRHTAGDGSLVRWVEPRLVVEVACTDAQGEDSEGAPITRWTVRHGASGWDPIGPMPCASLLHPVLVRVREDKQVNEVDVRLSQLSERCVVAAIDAAASAIALPRSVVTRREVWTKETKGKRAVRKLVVWQTNKEAHVEGWPAWVVHFTDYSPDRKTPLERTVKTAISGEEAGRIADALVAENVKKGWEPAGAASAPRADATTAEGSAKAPSAEPSRKPRKTSGK